MIETPASLLSWNDREKDLGRTIRYHKFEVMFYRTDLALHSARVQEIVRRLLPFVLRYYPELDANKALLIAKFHDDPEMVSKRGDVPLQAKLKMSSQEILQLKNEEAEAADLLADSYGNPRIAGYAYRDLLAHSLLKDCPEAHLHSFADKLDGYGEALHEVLAGNICFLEPVINYVARIFNRPSEVFYRIAKAFETDSGPFAFPIICLNDYFENGRVNGAPHTVSSVMRRTKIPHYEMWKEATLSLPNGLEILTTQKESR